MEIVFLGVGSAFDQNQQNTSCLINSKTKLLLDCGFSAFNNLFKFNPSPNFLDAIYISHCHADHYFGIPPLLIKMIYEGRTKDFTFICKKEFIKKIKKLIELGYPKSLKKAPFKVNFLEIKENYELNFNELILSIAKTDHSINNYAIKIRKGKKSVCYSGDGNFNEKTRKLYRNSNLVICESYYFEKQTNDHAIVVDLIKMADVEKIKILALVHLEQQFRKNNLRKLKTYLSKQKTKVIVPKVFDTITI